LQLVRWHAVAERIEERIKDLLAARLQIPAEVLTASDGGTSLLGRGIGLDSMEALTLANALEAEFGIAIPDDDLTVELFATIGSVADYVRRAT
jgi:acyl carrier protein